MSDLFGFPHPTQIKINNFLTIGRGGIDFHGALAQGTNYRLFVGMAHNSHQIQVLGEGVSCIIPITSRSLKAVRRAFWQLSLVSESFTFVHPVTEAAWHAANPVGCEASHAD